MCVQRWPCVVKSMLLVALLAACSVAQTPQLPSPTVVPTPPPTSQPTPAVQDTAPAALASGAPVYAAHGPYAAGTRDFALEGGETELTVTVWYPALNPDSAREEIVYHVYDGFPRGTWGATAKDLTIQGRAIQDAPPDQAHGSYPLVDLLNGSGRVSPIECLLGRASGHTWVCGHGYRPCGGNGGYPR